MLKFIQTYRKNFEFKVLKTSRWGTVETFKHDCLTYDEEFGDFPIFRFQINYGLGASSVITTHVNKTGNQNWWEFSNSFVDGRPWLVALIGMFDLRQKGIMYETLQFLKPFFQSCKY